MISSLCSGPTKIRYITGSETNVGMTSTEVPNLVATSLATDCETCSFLKAPIWM